jgi:hypothetical protein
MKSKPKNPDKSSRRAIRAAESIISEFSTTRTTDAGPVGPSALITSTAIPANTFPFQQTTAQFPGRPWM